MGGRCGVKTMRMGEIEFPYELNKALEDGRLVIFAGAGVSMSPPTCAPGFDTLVKEIGANTNLIRNDGEPFPDFLGRLESVGIDVHAAACDIIRRYNQQPSRLHEAILKLFPTSDSIKIVTTNFDSLFASACKDIFGIDATSYCAPSPPISKEFNGIVYLHGNLDRLESLVLTDADYGGAYMTKDDGWASRFIRRLFREYTILFIGYSHDDLPLRYIERALGQDVTGGRFALTDIDNIVMWRNLGITPIIYSSESQHAELHRTLAFWGDYLSKDYLRHETRIKSIVAEDPPITGDDLAYINLAIRHPVLIQFFIRHASKYEWLEFVKNQQLLTALFQINAPFDGLSLYFARWIAEKYVRRFPIETLDLVGCKNQYIHFGLWSAITRELYINKPEPSILNSWVVILLQSAYQFDNQGFESILNACSHPEDDNAIIILFDYLTQPLLKARKPWYPAFPDEARLNKMDWDVTLRGRSFYLNKTWEEILHPNLGLFKNKLSHIVENNLVHTYYLFRSVGAVTDKWDPISCGRQKLWEDHSRFDENINILITIMRHIIDWTIANQPEEARLAVFNWWDSDMIVFRRLAMYGISYLPCLTPEMKIHWLLRQNLLYEGEYKPDVFHFLGQVYPLLEPHLRNQLLDVVCAGPDNYGRTGEYDTFQYEIYNLLYWLTVIDSDDAYAVERLDEMQKKNPDFRPRKYPDLNVWVESGFTHDSSPPPKDAQQLLSEDPLLAVEFLLEYGPNRKHESHYERSEFLNEVSQAVAQSLEWGWKLIDALAQLNEWESDIWEAILQGLVRADLRKKDWQRILRFLLRSDVLLYRRSELIARFLEQIRNRENCILSADNIAMAERLTEKVWHECPDDLDSYDPDSDIGYINATRHPCGPLTEFMLWVLSYRRNMNGVNWQGIPRKYKHYITRITRADTIKSQLSCVMLGRHLYFLHYIDSTWISSVVIPKFDWLINPIDAELFWQGFLSQNRLGSALFSELLDYYLQSLRRVTDWSEFMRKMLANHIASAAMYMGRNPIREGWLLQYIGNTETLDREAWASTVLQILATWDSGILTKTWNDWLKEYWELRINQASIPLDLEESKIMLEWIPYLDPVFDEAVSLACKTPISGEMHSSLLYDIKAKNYDIRHPQAAAKLLLYLLRNAEAFYSLGEVEEMVCNLANQGVDKPILVKICNELARLGCPTANELKDLCMINGMDSGD